MYPRSAHLFMTQNAAWSHGMELEITTSVFQEDGDEHAPDTRGIVPRGDRSLTRYVLSLPWQARSHTGEPSR